MHSAVFILVDGHGYGDATLSLYTFTSRRRLTYTFRSLMDYAKRPYVSNQAGLNRVPLILNLVIVILYTLLMRIE